jgi:hypothetical protein
MIESYGVLRTRAVVLMSRCCGCFLPLLCFYADLQDIFEHLNMAELLLMQTTPAQNMKTPNVTSPPEEEKIHRNEPTSASQEHPEVRRRSSTWKAVKDTCTSPLQRHTRS